MELVKLLPVHRYSVDMYSYVGPWEYWLLTEIGTWLKLVLGGVRVVAISISSS